METKAINFIEKIKTNDRAILSALGDSLTFGYMVEVGYLNVLEKKLKDNFPEANLEVKNFGVCGETIIDGLNRLNKTLLAFPTNLAIIQFGINDAFSGISLNNFEYYFNDTINKFKSSMSDSDIILVPPPPLKFKEEESVVLPFRKIFENIALKNNVIQADVEKTWSKYNSNESLWLFDGVHPGEQGYRLIAEAIFNKII